MNVSVHHITKQFLPPIFVDLLKQILRERAPKERTCISYQQDFAEFIAGRRGISLEAASKLVYNAEAQFPGGWSGLEYRRFTELALETFRPLHDETYDGELIETYQFHGPADFLRMLGYRIPSEEEVGAIVARLSTKREVGIVDYGCGLAHRTLFVARQLKARGLSVKLTFVDIHRQLHFEFLGFLCRKYGIIHDFIEISAGHLYPALPPHDYCDTVSVLEHVREPLRVINNIDVALNPGGVFLAAIEDQIQEMMHISSNLRPVRDRLIELGYRRIAECCNVPLLQKAGRGKT